MLPVKQRRAVEPFPAAHSAQNPGQVVCTRLLGADAKLQESTYMTRQFVDNQFQQDQENASYHILIAAAAAKQHTIFMSF